MTEKNIGQTSDGYHTFNELYEHRNTLYIALCKLLKDCGDNIWRSVLHSDGTHYNDYFILGINSAKGKQVTYHLPDSLWDSTDFAITLYKAPVFDGHTSEQVLTRLMNIAYEDNYRSDHDESLF